MATNNQINRALSGAASATGSFVGDTDPTMVSADYGVPTITSLNFGASSTAGVIGTATNDNAATGYVGEFVSSSVLVGSAVSLTDGVAQDITTISLGAGDWDVSGMVVLLGDGSCVSTNQVGGFSNASATLSGTVSETASALGANGETAVSLHPNRQSLAGTTTLYLIGQAFFSAGAVSAYGFISARRVR